MNIMLKRVVDKLLYIEATRGTHHEKMRMSDDMREENASDFIYTWYVVNRVNQSGAMEQALDDYEALLRQGMITYIGGEDFLKLLPPIKSKYVAEKGDCPNHIAMQKKVRRQ